MRLWMAGRCEVTRCIRSDGSVADGCAQGVCGFLRSEQQARHSP
jgi:hypothetical protein